MDDRTAGLRGEDPNLRAEIVLLQMIGGLATARGGRAVVRCPVRRRAKACKRLSVWTNEVLKSWHGRWG